MERAGVPASGARRQCRACRGLSLLASLALLSSCGGELLDDVIISGVDPSQAHQESSYPRLSQEDAAKFETFLDWLKTGQAFLSAKVAVSDHTPTGVRGIVVTEPIKKGELLYHIPRALMMTDVEASKDQPGLLEYLQESAPGEGVADTWLPDPAQWALAVYTASERCKGSKSKYAPWLAVLPGCPSHFCLSDEAIMYVDDNAHLFNTSKYALNTWKNHLENRSFIIARTEQILTYLQGTHPQFQESGNRGPTCGLQDLLWGLGMVASRDFRVYREGEHAATPEDPTLITVPFADMPNHSFDEGHALSILHDEHGNPAAFRLFARKDFSPGDEIFLQYHGTAISDVSWLWQYGIVLPYNPGASYQISIEVRKEAQNYGQALIDAALEHGLVKPMKDDKENSGFDFKWLLKYNQLPDLQTWAIIRAMGMNQERLSGDNPLLGKAALTGLEVPTDIVAQIRSLMKAVDWIEQVREPEAWTPDWMYEVDLITAREYLNQGKTFLYNLIMIKAGALRVLNSLHGKLSALLEVERSYYKLGVDGFVGLLPESLGTLHSQ